MTICIIGHGPSLNGAGRGQEIDNYGLIVRMGQTNHWMNPVDYGNKTHIVCQTAKPGKVRTMRNYCPIPEYHTYMWFKKRTSKKNFKLNTIERIDPTLVPEFKIISAQETVNFWQKKFLAFSPAYRFITRGTAAIAIIGDFHMWMKENPNRKITLLGCDNLKAAHSGGFRHGPHGFVRTHQPHDYAAEHLLVEEMEKYYHMEVTYE